MSTLDHKERIIQAAYTIGARGGLVAISARAVAEDAGVSVGYLYKVFPSKSDIMVAAARRYFEFSLSQELCRIESNESFVQFCRRLWEQTKAAFASFHREWLRDYEELPKQDLLAAHEAMGSVLAHARAQLESVLEQDTRINWALLPQRTAASAIAEFTMRSLLTSLEKGDEDCELLLTFLERGLYNAK
ncbi:TetR/AcrR family transcriptional regulator [uncultured Actinomyces sp.]|uniref:TetR/AcrR family transcriptional regulator n=1 Tax=uncultured Actinomyces sp. TaxID=249061 RepID=UPI00260FFE2A|nr:TetR/AcrR family transcriptional regulator [uncultured Actinomyces sp.]